MSRPQLYIYHVIVALLLSAVTCTEGLQLSPSNLSNIRSAAVVVYQSSGVQKVLQLGAIAGVGAFLRGKLDAGAITSLLLNALVPAVIVTSLSTVRVTPELGGVAAAGCMLAAVQLVAGDLASRALIKQSSSNSSPIEMDSLRRTTAVQLGTMAPALSVFSFTREFVGKEWAGLAALADVPTKIYSLLLIPYMIRFRAAKLNSSSDQSTSSDIIAKTKTGTETETETETKRETVTALLKTLLKLPGQIIKDPFNLAITTGLILALMGRPAATGLGFVGKALSVLAEAQTAVLFLLIGLKFKLGDGMKLNLPLLMARHGIVALFTSAFLTLFLPLDSSSLATTSNTAARTAARLTATLSSQAACSIISFGQISKAQATEPGLGYDCEVAFDLVALSFPFSIILNTVTCLIGAAYVDNLSAVGIALVAGSAVLSSFFNRS